MTPWQIAKQWWDKHSTQDFWEAVGEHLSAGYVWNSPTTFVMFAPCRWNAEDKYLERNGEHNCWFVSVAAAADGANRVCELLRVAPRPMPYVAWCRRGSFEPRVYSWEQLSKKVRL